MAIPTTIKLENLSHVAFLIVNFLWMTVALRTQLSWYLTLWLQIYFLPLLFLKLYHNWTTPMVCRMVSMLMDKTLLIAMPREFVTELCQPWCPLPPQHFVTACPWACLAFQLVHSWDLMWHSSPSGYVNLLSNPCFGNISKH